MAGKKTSKATKSKKAKTSGGARLAQGARKGAPLVVSYGINWESERGGLLNRIIRELGFSLRKVNPSQLNDPVGFLAGMVAYRPAAHPFEGEAPEDEFLLLCNLGKRQLDDFLMALKAVGVAIPHKAILTKENRSWPFHLLISQVSQEHEQLASIAANSDDAADGAASDADIDAGDGGADGDDAGAGDGGACARASAAVDDAGSNAGNNNNSDGCGNNGECSGGDNGSEHSSDNTSPSAGSSKASNNE